MVIYLNRYRALYQEMAIRRDEFTGDIKDTFDNSFNARVYKQYKKYPEQVLAQLSGTHNDRVLLDMEGNLISTSGKVQAKKKTRSRTDVQGKALQRSVNMVLQALGVDSNRPPNEIRNVLQKFIDDKKDEQKILVDPIDKLGAQIAAIKTIQKSPLTAEEQTFTRHNDFPKFLQTFQKMPAEKLGQILTQRTGDLSKKEALKKLYDEHFDNIVKFMGDKSTNTLNPDELCIVVSRRMIDFASQSTCQDWTSCQNLRGGSMNQYVGKSFAHGAMVSYLMKRSDIGPDLSWKSLDSSDLHGALARVLIKPSHPVDENGVEQEGEPFWYVDRVYKASSTPNSIALKFRSKVVDFFADHAMNLPHGEYKMSKAHYNDGGEYDVKVDDVFKYAHAGDYSNMEKLPPEFLEQLFNRYPKMVVQNWDMTKDFPNIYIETLDLSGADIRRLPRGIRAKNYNLSGTNIEKFAI